MLPDQFIRDQLKDKIVGIAGCGGLGSNCAVALARVGVGKLVVADFDKVELSNLNRQYFFRDQLGQNKAFALRDIISKIDPEIVVEAHDIYLEPESIVKLYSGCDVIVEAFDTAEMKLAIIETISESVPGIPLVCGVGLAGWGHNNTLFQEDFDNIFICGDREAESNEKLPPLSPRVGIVANMEANLVLELLLGKMK